MPSTKPPQNDPEQVPVEEVAPVKAKAIRKPKAAKAPGEAKPKTAKKPPSKKPAAKKPAKPKVVKPKPVKPTFTCDYCKRLFKLERAFLTHSCTMKRRYLSKDDKANRVGFITFQRFWNRNYRNTRPRDYADFAKSQLYSDLVAFGKYIHDINAIRPEAFIDFLLRVEVPLKKWQSPLVYQRYVRELAKKETPYAAIERNFLLMQQWAQDYDEEWTDFFRKVPTTLATMWIVSGRLSPWVLYVAPSAIDLMTRLNEEQIGMIQSTIEPKFWAIKLKVHAKDVDIIKQEMEAVGL